MGMKNYILLMTNLITLCLDSTFQCSKDFKIQQCKKEEAKINESEQKAFAETELNTKVLSIAKHF